ncbi:MAG: tyrosine-type recombinase/integrase [Hyphomonas sp.]|nr:tyrosine-type recombinase/integrase [Hyphomonas sp.]
MAGTLNRLTANEAKAAKGRQMLADGGGLYLQVSDKGAKSWLFRYRWKGKRPEIGLGSYPAVSLADARKRAEIARAALAEMPPKDPQVALKGAQGEGVVTFWAFVEEWSALNFPSMRSDRHKQEWLRSLKAYAEPLHDMPIDAISPEDVLNCLRPIWHDKRVTAQRVRGRIEKLLDAAKAKQLREGDNPARWRGHLDALLPNEKREVKHHAAIPFEDIPAFFERLRDRPLMSARVVEFVLLTGARVSEACKAKWSEFDLDNRVWKLSADRMKGGREHRVPLSDAAMAILKSLHDARISDYVFPGLKPKQAVARTTALKTLKEAGGHSYTVHGLRSAFRDWAGECTSFPRDVAEMALAHIVESKVERAYRRGDALEKRRALMQLWANYCTGNTSAQVVWLRG